MKIMENTENDWIDSLDYILQQVYLNKNANGHLK